jgi:hypothetical protein
MQNFLQRTAEDIYQKYGEDMASVAVVFPNNRAKLFFCEYLFQKAGKPVWTPGFITISNLFREQSKLDIADPIALVGVLYKIYIKFSGKEESFDEFYLWGEILLSDFDDTDKNMADARQLFRNIKEQAQYTDTLEHLSEEQVDSIRLFFKNFNPDRKTELKQRFIDNWNILYEVYQGFQEELESKGLAYEGMLYRRVVEKMKEEGVSGFRYEKYAFVGFNLLNQSETALFSLLQKAGKAIFYWDYDTFYLREPKHEAARFIRKNIELFPNELGKSGFDNFENIPKKIRFISASTENAQARYLPEWIRDLQIRQGDDFNPAETAVVLCNEGLLLPVLHSVPDDILELNVTMGFPISQTPVFSLLNAIALLHADGFYPGPVERFNYRYVLTILQHPLIRQNSFKAEELENSLKKANSFRPAATELQEDQLLRSVFTPVEEPKVLAERMKDILRDMAEIQRPDSNDDDDESTIADYDPMYSEAIFRCYTLVNRLYDLIEQGQIEVNIHTFQKLLMKMLSTASIPFSGEPVRGMQIMGMLETRNLDFRNILILSVNEGMLPKGSTDTSFIPYNLRKGFGLTTTEHKDSIFAYYFFRLLQRAENICLVYNTSTDGLNRGEMSRFMLQLQIESSHTIEHFNLSSGIELTSPREIRIDKTQEIIDILKRKYDMYSGKETIDLSPTAINSLLDCPLRFYLRHIAGLKEPEEVIEEIDGAVLGNFFHHSAEHIYTHILLKKAGKDYTNAAIEEAITNGILNKAIENHEISGRIETIDLEQWLDGTFSIDEVVDHYFRKEFFMISDEKEKPVYNGEQLIKRKLTDGFLKTLLTIDRQMTPFEIVAMEKRVSEAIEVETPAGRLKLTVGGRIDRIDKKDGILRVLDYKTGGNSQEPRSVDDLFETEGKRASYIFQIFLYSAILQKNNPENKVKPQILYINAAAKKDYSLDVKIGEARKKEIVSEILPYMDDFSNNLDNTFKNLFDETKPFCQTDVAERCEWCDFKRICRR